MASFTVSVRNYHFDRAQNNCYCAGHNYTTELQIKTIFLRNSPQKQILRQKEDYFHGFEIKIVKKLKICGLFRKKKGSPKKVVV